MTCATTRPVSLRARPFAPLSALAPLFSPLVGLLGLFGCLGLLGCAPDAPGVTPESTVLAFVGAMERSSQDDRARAEAFALLDAGSRAELERRARRASHLARRAVEPWEMLAQGSLRLRAPLDRMRTELDGERATVHVEGASREVAIPLVLETTDDEPRWRLVLLPEAAAPDTPTESEPARPTPPSP